MSVLFKANVSYDKKRYGGQEKKYRKLKEEQLIRSI
jgi:hypothetical protein